ncbi:MAG TPA: hypothetical protein PLB25_07570 [Rhodoferax sp.]|nr:hypothetical protein [Rhodoferax sp.]
MFDISKRVFSLCLALASAEMLHGITRIRYLVPLVGKSNAQKISIVTGTLLAFGVCYVFIPAMGLTTRFSAIALGVFLAAFMASFDIAVGRLLMRRKWALIAEDFDPRKGNYLVFGLAALVAIPTFVLRIA